MSDFRMNAQNAAQYYKENMIGKRYRHFKGGIYIVTDIAVHSETARLMVIYKNFNDDSKINCTWARPLAMFLSEVDKEKYPDAKQEFRFEQIAEMEKKDGKID